MIRLTVVAPAVLFLFALSTLPTAAQAQPANDAQTVVDALRANPYVLPYEIQVTPGKNGSIILSGKVGTKQIHDVVIRTVINLGLIPHDDLVIDTAEAHRAALNQSYYGSQAGLSASMGTAPYFAYPPPLFGRLDDPFWGLVPPILSFPPGYTRAVEPVRTAPARAAAPPNGQDDDSIKGDVKLVIDAAGQVFLSGEVATEKDRRDIEREVQEAVGGAPIASDLQVAERAAPPPPPEPMIGSPNKERAKAPNAKPEPEAKPEPIGLVTPRDANPLTDRAVKALGRRATLKDSPISVRSNDDVVTLSGKVPSAYEAMLAYRAVEQTPGVHDVIDQLEFPMPDENHPNPLKGKADADDLEPYLTYQIRRHTGDVAHIDRVRVRGDVVEVHGSLQSDDDKARIAATLRSIPLLRDFRIESSFHVD